MIVTCCGVIPDTERPILMEEEGRGDVICQNPGYATGSAEASDHLRNTLGSHFDQASIEIVQV